MKVYNNQKGLVNGGKKRKRDILGRFIKYKPDFFQYKQMNERMCVDLLSDLKLSLTNKELCNLIQSAYSGMFLGGNKVIKNDASYVGWRKDNDCHEALDQLRQKLDQFSLKYVNPLIECSLSGPAKRSFQLLHSKHGPNSTSINMFIPHSDNNKFSLHVDSVQFGTAILQLTSNVNNFTGLTLFLSDTEVAISLQQGEVLIIPAGIEHESIWEQQNEERISVVFFY